MIESTKRVRPRIVSNWPASAWWIAFPNENRWHMIDTWANALRAATTWWSTQSDDVQLQALTHPHRRNP